MIDWWLDLRNRLDYNIRQAVRWTRPFRDKEHPDGRKMFTDFDPQKVNTAIHIANRISVSYHINDYQNETKTGNYQENLFYLHMLESAFQQANATLPDPANIIDIGSSHWFYAHALWSFCSWYKVLSPRSVQITAFEGDPYRVYADFHSRYDHAIRNIAVLPGMQYTPEPFRAIPGSCDLVTMFFPFVFKNDHLRWGLPLNQFHPQGLLRDAWISLKSGGRLLVVNQGKEEHKQQLDYFKQAGIQVAVNFHMDKILFEYELDRYIIMSTAHD